MASPQDHQSLANTIKDHVAQQRETLIQFLRDLCAIPSYDSQIGPVGERAAQEMRKLGFDEVRFDQMGKSILEHLEQQRKGGK